LDLDGPVEQVVANHLRVFQAYGTAGQEHARLYTSTDSQQTIVRIHITKHSYGRQRVA
jgi:hypothetical protein